MANNWGGRRPGAGRPIGSKQKMPTGVYRAMRTMRQGAGGPRRWRVPDEAPEELKELADFALERIEDVLRERVIDKQAQNVLKAAAMIREEVCGPHVRRVEVSVGLDQMLAEVYDSGQLSAAKQVLELPPSDLSISSSELRRGAKKKPGNRDPAREERGAENEERGSIDISDVLAQAPEADQ